MKKFKLFIVLFVLVIITYIFAFSNYGLFEILSNDAEIEELNNDIESVKEECSEINGNIEKLDSLAYIEKYARENLNMVKKDEYLVKFIPFKRETK